MTTAFSYIRMSTPEQIRGDSLRRQLERSRRLAEARGWTLDESLKDLGKSAYRGSHITDGAFGEFLERIKSGQVPKGSVLIVESLDRLSREAVPVALQNFLAIINAGVVLVTLDSEPPREFRSDTLNEMDLMISIVGMSRAHGESKRKSDLLKPAWEQKRRQARETKKPLTSRLPTWLRLVDGQFEVIPERAEVVREMFEMTAAGIGREKLCKILNARGIPSPGGGAWGNSGVTHILDSQAVIGRFQPSETYYKNGQKMRRPVGDVIEGYFPPIIPVDLFNRAHAAKNSRAISSGGRTGWTYSNIFRGLCYCGSCGGKMEYFNKGNNWEKGGRYFMCSSVKRGSGCQGKGTYRYEHFEKGFLDNCNHFDFNQIAAHQSAELTRVRERLAQLTLERSDLDKRYDNLLDLAETSGMTDRIKTRVAELESALLANAAEREQLTSQEAALAHANQSDALRQLQEIRGEMAKAEGENLYRIRAQLSALIREFVQAIVFHEGSAYVMIGQKTSTPPVWAIYAFTRGKLTLTVKGDDLPDIDDYDYIVPGRGTGTDRERAEAWRVADDAWYGFARMLKSLETAKPLPEPVG